MLSGWRMLGGLGLLLATAMPAYPQQDAPVTGIQKMCAEAAESNKS
jgi:hypothetical protein